MKTKKKINARDEIANACSTACGEIERGMIQRNKMNNKI